MKYKLEVRYNGGRQVFFFDYNNVNSVGDILVKLFEALKNGWRVSIEPVEDEEDET